MIENTFPDFNGTFAISFKERISYLNLETGAKFSCTRVYNHKNGALAFFGCPNQLQVPSNMQLKMRFCTKNRIWPDFDEKLWSVENPVGLRKCIPGKILVSSNL